MHIEVSAVMALASVARYHSAQHARCSRGWRLCLSQTVATDLHSSSRIRRLTRAFNAAKNGSCQRVWPALPYAAWKDTFATLHLWTQIVCKIRLAQTPRLNHSWHVTLYVSPRGLTTSPIPYGCGADLQIALLARYHAANLEEARG
jgi:Family of unknown function (DUF5996)